MLGAMRVESIFISDVHLGQSGCRATQLLAFLAELFVNSVIHRARRILGLPDWSLTAFSTATTVTGSRTAAHSSRR